MTPLLTLSLLGPVQLTRSDHQPVRLRRKSRLLLYYLAAQSQVITREHVMHVFWPDEPIDTARQLLRTALYQIKVACGDVIISHHQQLSIATPQHVTVDLHEWRQCAPGNPAVDVLVHAPVRLFCQDVGVSGSIEFDTWLDAERLHWQQFCADLLFRHAERLTTQQTLNEALTSCLSAHRYAPLREDIVQLAMQLKYHTNDRAGAIALYVDLEKALDEQLGVPPLPATSAVYDQVITDNLEFHAEVTTPTGNLTVSVPPLIGRSAELAQLQHIKWNGQIVCIEGESGIGKTHLAREFLRQSAAMILHIAAFAGDQYIPYHGLITTFRHLFQQPAHRDVLTTPVLSPLWQSELRRLWPELPGADPASLAPEAGETRLPEALALLLTHLCAQQRVAIFIDDAQWVDEATLRIVQSLVRRDMPFPWLCVLTLRTDIRVEYVQNILHQSEHAQQLTRIPLGVLDTQAIHDLVAQINPNADAHIVERAEGNPFMLIELLKHSPHAPLPSAIRELIQTRIQQLSPAAQRLLDGAAICGREFHIAEAVYLSQLDEHDMYQAIDEVSVHGLVHIIDGKHGRFHHPLTVESINHVRGAMRTTHLHRTLAQWLIQQPDQNHARIATHLLAAGDTSDLVPHALAAARDAHSVGAWHNAEQFMHTAIHHSQPTTQAALWLECGEMLFMAGNETGAITALQHAIDLDESPTGEISDAASVAMARSFIPIAHYVQAIELCLPLSTHHNPDIAMQAAFVCGSAYSLLGEDLEQARTYLDLAEHYCRQLDNQAFMARIIFEQAGLLAQQGALTQAIARYTDALQSAEQTNAPAGQIWRVLAHNNLAYHLHLLGSFRDAQRHIRLAFRLAERYGQRMMQSYLYSTAGEIALAQHDLNHAEQHFNAGLGVAEHYQMHERIAGLTANLGRVKVARHEHEAAIALFEHALAQAEHLGIRHLATQIRIWLIPLLPAEQADTHMAQAYSCARQGGRSYLIAQLDALVPHTNH